MIHAYQAEDLNQVATAIEIKASDLKLKNYVPLFSEDDDGDSTFSFLCM